MNPPRERRVRVLGGLPKGARVPIQIRIVDSNATDDSGAVMQRALRILAIMMVRSHLSRGDCEAIPQESRSSSALTVSPKGHPHDVDDAA